MKRDLLGAAGALASGFVVGAVLMMGFVSDGMIFAANGGIDARLEGKSANERANIKALEIVNSNPKGEYHDPTYGLRIEIQSTSKIDGGVEMFARAWSAGQQLGFGSDGTVEIERFRFVNPPILVDDPNGEIVREWTCVSTPAITATRSPAGCLTTSSA